MQQRMPKINKKKLVASAISILRTIERSDKIAEEFKSLSAIAIKVLLTSQEKFLMLRIIAKSAILGKSNEKLLPIYQKIGIAEKQKAL